MWIEILLFFIALLLLLYRYVTKNFSKWEAVGVPHMKGSFPFGSFNLMSGHIDTLTLEGHKKFANEKYFGWFFGGAPVLAINDPNLLKNIQVKDFDHFVDRLSAETQKKLFSGGDLDKIWELMLTSVTGDKWKQLRSVFSPMFTPGKMKGMLKFIKHTAGDLTNEIERKANKGEEFELKDVFGRFSIDALASAAFGVDGESFTNEDSKFVEYAAAIFQQSTFEIVFFTAKLIPGVAKLFSWLKLNTFKPKETKFFKEVILQTIRTRRETKERKNDLVDLMLDCIKEVNTADENDEPSDQYEQDMNLSQNKKMKHNFDELTIVSTALVLLTAGYDTTGITLSFLAYAMTKNPEVQMKLQEEIDQAYDESGGELPDYNVIQSLPYLDMVIFETLRMYSPVGMNTRVATKDYNLPGTDIVIKCDDMLSFNTKSLHFDPDHWTHPTEFYPEHFSKEEKATRSPYAYQAFGQGPRACIGMRFALLEAKVAVLSVLRKFSFKPGTKTIEPLVQDINSQAGWVNGGLWARVEARNDF